MQKSPISILKSSNLNETTNDEQEINKCMSFCMKYNLAQIVSDFSLILSSDYKKQSSNDTTTTEVKRKPPSRFEKPSSQKKNSEKKVSKFEQPRKVVNKVPKNRQQENSGSDNPNDDHSESDVNNYRIPPSSSSRYINDQPQGNQQGAVNLASLITQLGSKPVPKNHETHRDFFRLNDPQESSQWVDAFGKNDGVGHKKNNGYKDYVGFYQQEPQSSRSHYEDRNYPRQMGGLYSFKTSEVKYEPEQRPINNWGVNTPSKAQKTSYGFGQPTTMNSTNFSSYANQLRVVDGNRASPNFTANLQTKIYEGSPSPYSKQMITPGSVSSISQQLNTPFSHYPREAAEDRNSYNVTIESMKAYNRTPSEISIKNNFQKQSHFASSRLSPSKSSRDFFQDKGSNRMRVQREVNRPGVSNRSISRSRSRSQMKERTFYQPKYSPRKKVETSSQSELRDNRKTKQIKRELTSEFKVCQGQSESEGEHADDPGEEQLNKQPSSMTRVNKVGQTASNRMTKTTEISSSERGKLSHTTKTYRGKEEPKKDDGYFEEQEDQEEFQIDLDHRMKECLQVISKESNKFKQSSPVIEIKARK